MKPAVVVVEAWPLSAVDFLAALLVVVLCSVVESFDVDLNAGLDVVDRAVDLTDAEELVRTNFRDVGDSETLTTCVAGALVAAVTVGQNAVDEAPTTGAATKPEVEILAAGPPTIGDDA